MRNRLLLALVLLILSGNLSYAQISGTNVFLQGRWLEVGVDQMGAFGTCGSPTTYHSHTCYCSNICSQPGTDMDVMYDWGHDGWTVGAPCAMGNYTIPGFPQEGWSIQVGATEYRNWATGSSCSGSFSVPGSITGYTNSSGTITGTFTGNVAGLHIVQESRVDTQASWVVVTTKMYNTTGSAITGVYYERTCDPDNASMWGGSSNTENVIVHQNEDSRHDVMIGTYSTNTAYTTPAYVYNYYNSYMGLCTKDCRAKCGTISGLAPGNTPSQLWAGTGAVLTTLHDSSNNDVGIFLVFNIGTIAALGSPGDSAVVSYAYVYDGHNGIDSAFPTPEISVSGTAITSFPDTINACLYPGIDSLPIDLLFGGDKDWSWSSWTWTPGTGLSATTGTHVWVHFSALSGNTTYTVTGTDSALGMRDCLNKTLIFTVHACHLGYVNTPCLGDPLYFGMYGDSVGATYLWTGPGSFTSTLHDPVISPSNWGDTGTYRVIKNYFGSLDTDYVHVTIHPLPRRTPTSNIPNKCDAIMNPLTLFTNLDSANETFAWTGPNGFTSTLQDPVITPFDSSGQGTFFVTGTTMWGCKTTASTSVIPGINPGFRFTVSYGCIWDTVNFINTSYNANTYQWIFGDPTPNVSDRNTTHVYRANDMIVDSVILLLGNPNCTARIAEAVDLRHEVHAYFRATPDTLCLDAGANVTFVDSSYAVDSNVVYPGVPPATYAWNFGDGGTDNSSSPSHLFTKPGIMGVMLTVSDAMGCRDSITHPVYVVQLNIKSFHDTMLCISQPLPLQNEINSIPDEQWNYKYSWSESTPNLDNDTVQIPNLYGIGIFTDILTVTVPSIVPDGCPAMDTIVVNSVKGQVLSNLTLSQIIDYGSSIQLSADNEVYYHWLPNDGSLDNDNINNPIATPRHTTTYSVFGYDVNGCLDSAYITIYVDTSMNQDVPSGFTPNGDGNNDVFKPVGIKFQYLSEFRIFNRWGQEVFYTNSKDQGWDGKYHGTPQDMGVYNYVIIVSKPGGDNIVYKGTVTLVR